MSPSIFLMNNKKNKTGDDCVITYTRTEVLADVKEEVLLQIRVANCNNRMSTTHKADHTMIFPLIGLGAVQ